MTNTELREACKNLKSLEEYINQLKASAEEIKDNIRAEMHSREVSIIDLGCYIVRDTEVISQRFSSTDLRKVSPEIYQMFLKEIVSHKFSIA